MDQIENLCAQKGMRMTEQRRTIARVLSSSKDHPDVEELHRRAAAVDSRISIATVYRTVRLFEEAGILERHDFRDGRSRYENVPDIHHDHLIDMKTGKVIGAESLVRWEHPDRGLVPPMRFIPFAEQRFFNCHGQNCLMMLLS